MIHWDEKRPITVDILKRLSISTLAKALGFEEQYNFFASYESLPLLDQIQSKKRASA